MLVVSIFFPPFYHIFTDCPLRLGTGFNAREVHAIKTEEVSGACILLEKDTEMTSRQKNKSMLDSVLSATNKINRVI